MGISYHLKKIYSEMNLGPQAPQESPGASSWSNPGTSDAGNKGVRTGGTFDTAQDAQQIKFPTSEGLSEQEVVDVFKKLLKDLIDNNEKLSPEFRAKIEEAFKNIIS